MNKLIRIGIFLAIICSPGFAIYYGIQAMFATTHEEQFAKALTNDCKADWKALADQTFKRHGVWLGGDAPDYCYDHARNKKHYGYTN